MKRILLMTIAALALFVQGLFAADVTGKWVAEVEGRDGQKRTMTMNLKADGSALSGTVSSPMGESEISEGKVEGDDVSFVVNMEFNGQSRKIPYSGKLSGNELKMKSGTGERTREFTAKRAES